MTEEEKAAEKLRKEVEWADKYGWQSFRVPKERIRTLLAAYKRRGEALEPFARHVGKSGEVVVLKIGKDTWTGTLKTEHFEAASAAINQETHHG